MAMRYFVVRAGPMLPSDWLPPDWEGRWFPMDRFGFDPNDPMPKEGQVTSAEGVVVAVLIRTDRMERRDDGITAPVYEFWPVGPL